ncbi:methyltransferase domain-containing protein [Aureococcus anophagefferens]|nr:methyltransferase domain-containing protein [Aureococcus anophagefferens]
MFIARYNIALFAALLAALGRRFVNEPTVRVVPGTNEGIAALQVSGALLKRSTSLVSFDTDLYAEGLESLLPAFRAFGVLYEKAAASDIRSNAKKLRLSASKARARARSPQHREARGWIRAVSKKDICGILDSADSSKDSARALFWTTNKMPEIPASMAEPGLKVPATAWKWPRSWPYGKDGFRKEEGLVEEVLEGAPILDAAAGEALGGHLVRHLESGAGKVLEIDGSCSGASYIPADGGGEELWFPPNEVVKADAAAVLKEGGVLEYADESFDAVVLYSAAELVTSPRATFRELWRVLKPGGRAIVAFSAARCSPGGHAAQQAQAAGAPAAAMVATDDERAQQLWGAGWRGLRGYDYFSDADDGSENNPIAKLAKEKAKEASSGTPLFVVMADRAKDVPAGAGAAAAADNALWNVDHMEEDDKRLCATRLIQLIEDNEPDFGRREALAAQATRMLPDIYEVIKPMAVVIATPLLAQFSANVACRWDPASGAQRKALKEGLGMATPRDGFWKPLGDTTAALSVDDKLWLLADCLPHFQAYGDDEDAVPPALAALLRGAGDSGADEGGVLQRALALIGEKLPAFEDQPKQLLAIDLCARDYLAGAFGAAPPTTSSSSRSSGKVTREDATENAELADLDPEAAAKKKDDERRAKQVEAMLADIMKNKGGDDGPSDHAESPKNGDAVGVGTPLFGKKK